MAAAVLGLGPTTSSGVAEVVWEAVHDETARLRFISGAGAEALLASRCSPAQGEAFLAELRERFGLG